MATAKRLGIGGSVAFVGGVYGKAKEDCFTAADAFILPSFSEGLPLAVLEAWAYRLPVVMTPFCNLPEGFNAGAAIRVETDAESVAAGIRKLVCLNREQRLAMGNNGHALVVEKFTWQQVAASTMQLYKWAAGKEARPHFVVEN